MNEVTTLRFQKRKSVLGRWEYPVIAGVLSVGMVWLIIVGPWALHCAQAETDALDPGWRLADLESARAVIPDAENSALVIIAGNKLVPPNAIDAFKLGDANRNIDWSPAERLDDDALISLRTGLNLYRDALSQYSRLEAMSRGRWPGGANDPAQVEISLVPKYDPDIKTCLWVLYFDSWESIESGDRARAVKQLRSLLNCSHSIGDEPCTLSMLKRMHAIAMMLGGCERLLAHWELDETTLVKLQEELAAESEISLIRIAMRGERAYHYEFLENLTWKARPLVCDNALTFKLMYLPGMVAARQAELLTRMNQLVSIVDQPGESQVTLAKEWCRNIQEWAGFYGLHFSAVDRTFTANLKHEARLRTMIVALAAERYRLKEHRWPATLDDLVEGKFLPSVPSDPFTGKLLLWMEWPQGRIIYSVGENQIDDAGKVTLVKFGGGDIGWQLFDPDKRRQPAPPRQAPPG